ncbi:MAG: hypothetical protein OEM78_06145 [Gammaproteobacteria bacterium]|nr:hypothetical protein [Gammaproteobacteria bacterium]
MTNSIPERAQGRSKARAATRAVVCCLASLLVACKSDGGDADPPPASTSSGMCLQTSLQNCGPGPWDPFGIALSFAWISGQCTREVTCTAAPVQTDFDAGIVTDDFIAANWTTASAGETEPNDDPSQANPFVLQANSGLLFSGSLDDATDTVDFVALSFGRDASINGYTAYLCRIPDDCLQPWYEGDAAYLELLDQNGLVIQTTSTAPTHYFTFQASPGVLHYVAVRAAGTTGTDFDYKLIITD